MDNARETEAASIPSGDEGSIGRRHGRAMAVVSGLAIVAVLGGAAWASVALSGLSDPAAQKPAAEQVEPTDGKESGVAVSVKAGGWTDAVGPFEFAAVGEDGAVAKEGEVKPGENVSLKLADGVYALSITSIPTAAHGKTTWSPPASQTVVIEDGVATPAEISFNLLPVDPADEAAVETVIAELPEAEREAARAHLSAKREDPSSDEVAARPPRPAAGGKPSGGGTPSAKPPVAHKHAWVDVTEQRWVANNVWVVDQAAWDEVIPGKAYVLCSCGARFGNSREWGAHAEAEALNGSFDHSYTVLNEPDTTIHRDEVGHYEDRGRYETVVIGRRCSGCGQKGRRHMGLVRWIPGSGWVVAHWSRPARWGVGDLLAVTCQDVACMWAAASRGLPNAP